MRYQPGAELRFLSVPSRNQVDKFAIRPKLGYICLAFDLISSLVVVIFISAYRFHYFTIHHSGARKPHPMSIVGAGMLVAVYSVIKGLASGATLCYAIVIGVFGHALRAHRDRRSFHITEVGLFTLISNAMKLIA
jgi:hypothetical protein